MHQRTFVALLVTGLALATQSRLSAQGATRTGAIAIFDSRRVLDSLPGRSSAEAEFGLEQAKARTLVKMASDSLRASVDEFSRAEAGLTPKQREAAMMMLRARELTLEDMVAQLDAIVTRRMDELQAPLRDRIRDAVKTVRARRGYVVVIDIASIDGIVDADPAADITAEIVAEVRKR
ncbi:MAG: OmpH family outer membrane protein [Gemmatimonadaceae bacterium]|jgi:Skp family chaperone for outer membrane proteins|nr:OmpH family outer membrane protein [Gemmatimonadaceae bacterium]